MLKAVLIVLLLLIALCYAAFFLSWNGETKVNLVTWGFGSLPWSVPGVPVGFIPLAGAVLGALVMAIAAWGPWAAQRRAAGTAEAKVQKAIEKFNELKGRLGARDEEIQRLQERITELEQLPAPTSAPEAALEAPIAVEVTEVI